MRRLLLLILLSFLAHGLILSQTVYPSGIQGCLARWTFTCDPAVPLGPVLDHSGNGEHGTGYDVLCDTGFNHTPYSAARFNGTSSYIQVPYSGNLAPANISVFVVIKFDGFWAGNCQGNNLIYNGFNYNASQNWAFFVTDGSYDQNCNAFNPTKEKANFSVPNFVNNGIPNGDYIETGKWYLLGCTYNGSLINYYQIELDTSNLLLAILPSYSVACNTPIGNSPYPVLLGATQNPPFPYWVNGVYDEAVIFNHALSNLEIKSLYDYIIGNSLIASGLSENAWPDYSVSVDGRTIRLSRDHPARQVQVWTLSGQLIYRQLGNGTFSLDQFPSQVVLIRLTLDDGNTAVQKVLLR